MKALSLIVGGVTLLCLVAKLLGAPISWWVITSPLWIAALAVISVALPALAVYAIPFIVATASVAFRALRDGARELKNLKERE